MWKGGRERRDKDTCLDVAVHDAPRVEVADGLGHLDRHPDPQVPRRFIVLEIRAEIPSFSKLGKDIQGILELAHPLFTRKKERMKE